MEMMRRDGSLNGHRDFSLILLDLATADDSHDLVCMATNVAVGRCHKLIEG